jgi:hypothetical protein
VSGTSYVGAGAGADRGQSDMIDKIINQFDFVRSQQIRVSISSPSKAFPSVWDTCRHNMRVVCNLARKTTGISILSYAHTKNSGRLGKSPSRSRDSTWRHLITLRTARPWPNRPLAPQMQEKIYLIRLSVPQLYNRCGLWGFFYWLA